MGACECENPMEFGYEVEKEKEDLKAIKNKYKEININTLNKIEKNYINTMPNVDSLDNKREIINTYQPKGNRDFQDNIQNNEEITEEEGKNEEEERNEIEEKNDEKERNEVEEKNDEEERNEIEEKNEEGEKKIEEEESNLRSRYENEQNQNKDKSEIDTQLNNKENENETNNTNNEPDDFSQYIFDNINYIRENPQSFIPIIEQAKSNVMNDKTGICIYKSSVKVALSKGKPAFDEAIEYLKKLKPMNKLDFNQQLLIPLPRYEKQLKDKTYMNKIVNNKIQSGIPIKSFWRDIIKDRETCLILMIVDDTGPNSGKKRNDLLDPNMKSIGITTKKIGKSFASYVILC